MAARARIRSSLPSISSRIAYGFRPLPPPVPILLLSAQNRAASTAAAISAQDDSSHGEHVARAPSTQPGPSTNHTWESHHSELLDHAMNETEVLDEVFAKLIRRTDRFVKSPGRWNANRRYPEDSYAEISSKLESGEERTTKQGDMSKEDLEAMEVDALGETAARAIITALDTTSLSPTDQPLTKTWDTSTLEAVFHTLSSSSLYPPSLKLSLNLLDSLQRVRHPRSREIYVTLMNHCMAWRRPDWAAAVYVGLVEEWIMEGRIAEGGRIEEYREGGGPKAMNLQSGKFFGHNEVEKPRMPRLAGPGPVTDTAITTIRQRTASWFHGVRTRRFPGEALAPGERLDLWHPKKLALHEKMRGFPMPIPTSPPSLVPEPDKGLLSIILNGLDLEQPKPGGGSKHREPTYERSVLALATIANTILSRTLPVTAIPPLLKAFQAVPPLPLVLPRPLTPTEEEREYAYTAHTHIRHAMISLFLSPPTSRMIHPGSLAHIYRLPPLGLDACNVLLNVAFRYFREPVMIKGLLGYMKKSRQLAVGTYNTILRGASLLKWNPLAASAAKVLLGKAENGESERIGEGGGDVSVGIQRSAVRNQDDSMATSVSNRLPENDITPYDRPVIDIPRPEEPVIPDVISLTSLLAHYTSTSQHNEVIALVNKLFPSLKTTLDDTLNTSAISATSPTAADLLARSRLIPPAVYVAILNGLEKAARTGLAVKVFRLAKDAEWASRQSEGGGWYLPIHAYTIMIQVYGNEMRVLGTLKPSAVVEGMGTIERTKKAFAAAWRLYQGTIVMSKSEPPLSGLSSSQSEFEVACSRPPVLDARFFNAYYDLLSTASTWQSEDVSVSLAAQKLSKDLPVLTAILEDTRAAGLEPPSGWVQRRALMCGFLDEANVIVLNLRNLARGEPISTQLSLERIKRETKNIDPKTDYFNLQRMWEQAHRRFMKDLSDLKKRKVEWTLPVKRTKSLMMALDDERL